MACLFYRNAFIPCQLEQQLSVACDFHLQFDGWGSLLCTRMRITEDPSRCAKITEMFWQGLKRLVFIDSYLMAFRFFRCIARPIFYSRVTHSPIVRMGTIQHICESISCERYKPPVIFKSTLISNCITSIHLTNFQGEVFRVNWFGWILRDSELKNWSFGMLDPYNEVQ